LTFISIRGRQQGDPKAAKRFGEILVALEFSAVLKCRKKKARNDEPERQDQGGSKGEVRVKKKKRLRGNIPITL